MLVSSLPAFLCARLRTIQDKYLYRALDSTGQTIGFLLKAKRDKAAAKRFLVKAIEASGNPMPRVMNMDKNPAYPAAMEDLKATGVIPRRVLLRQCRYLNNVIEQDHRSVKKRTAIFSFVVSDY